MLPKHLPVGGVALKQLGQHLEGHLIADGLFMVLLADDPHHEHVEYRTVLQESGILLAELDQGQDLNQNDLFELREGHSIKLAHNLEDVFVVHHNIVLVEVLEARKAAYTVVHLH